MENSEFPFPSDTPYAEVVRKFCAWAEDNTRKHYQKDFLYRCVIAAELYWRSTLLPGIGGDVDLWELQKGVDKRVSRSDMYKDPVRTRFATLTIDDGDNPYGSLDEMGASIAGMADNLAEVYHGLKQVLERYDAGETDRAMILWRLGFEHEWGWQLADALSTIHSILFDPLY